MATSPASKRKRPLASSKSVGVARPSPTAPATARGDDGDDGDDGGDGGDDGDDGGGDSAVGDDA